jgi:hypothetical protein
MSTLRKLNADELVRAISSPSRTPTRKEKIEELLRANALASHEEERLPRRMVNIVKELVAWLEELERQKNA